MDTRDIGLPDAKHTWRPLLAPVRPASAKYVTPFDLSSCPLAVAYGPTGETKGGPRRRLTTSPALRLVGS